ncbi:hypothetical protein, partial [Klebsiella quasipneumoniae]
FSRVSWFVGVIVAFAAYALLKKRAQPNNLARPNAVN